MTCEICGEKSGRVSKTTRTFGSGRPAFLIEGVPVVRCFNCGESYFTAATLKELERIRKDWRKLAVAKRVPVAKFKGAA